MVEVAVVVPTFRRLEGLRRLIEALEAQTLAPPRWELVIVDDASGGGTGPAIDELATRSPLMIRVIHLPANRGQAAARNIGWRSCRAPVLAFTDDDCVPSEQWLEAGLEVMGESPVTGIVQGLTRRPGAAASYEYTLRTVVREVLAPSPWFEGCNLFVRRAALEASGGFDEVLADFAEDTALGWSVMAAGWQRAWAPEAVVEHELSERPYRWHLRFHYLQGNIVHVARRYPQLRTLFWRPWAVAPDNAYFALAVTGAALALRWRSAVVLVGPYLIWLYGPPERRSSAAAAARIGAFKVATHAASLAGKLRAGATARTLVL